MGKGPTAIAKIPEEVLAKQNWPDLIARLTAVAHRRLPAASIEDARQLAKEAVRVFLDPESTVTWDYEKEPDPSWCLGSILNGLLRNHFRRGSTRSEEAAETEALVATADASADRDRAERQIIARDLLQKVLSRVYEMSAGDSVVQDIALLADEGLFEIEQQMEKLKVPKARLYEARRRFTERVRIARRELEGGAAVMTEKPNTGGEALDDLERVLAGDMLDPATPIELVHAYLRSAGGNPEEIRNEAAEFVRVLLERRRLSWQEKARQRISKRAPLLARVTRFAEMTEAQLVQHFNRLRSDPSLGPSVAGAFRKRRAEESTVEELRSFLQEIEALRAIEADEGDGEGDE